MAEQRMEKKRCLIEYFVVVVIKDEGEVDRVMARAWAEEINLDLAHPETVFVPNVAIGKSTL